MLEAAVLAVAVVAVVVAVVLVVVPIDVAFALERRDTVHAEIALRWMSFRWRRELGRPEKKPPKPRKRSPSERSYFRTFQAVWDVPGKLQAVTAFLRRLGRSFRLVGIDAYVRFGTGDPADTGRLWGIVAPALIWANQWLRLDLVAEPAFTDADVRGFVRGSVRLFPVRVVWAVIRMLVSLTMFRVAWAIVRTRPEKGGAG